MDQGDEINSQYPGPCGTCGRDVQGNDVPQGVAHVAQEGHREDGGQRGPVHPALPPPL